MSARYELWLTNDSGRRMALLKDFTYLSYTRATRQFGSLEFGYPFDLLASRFFTWFQPDWRVEVWRSAARGIPMRREDVFLLRKPHVYARAEDGVRIIRYYGRNGRDLLKRRHVAQRAGTTWASKTGAADDMMKEIVREQMLYGSAVDENGNADNSRAFPEGEFSVQGNVGAGPQITMNFEGKNVLEVLKSISEATFQKNAEDESDLRIFFSVEPVSLSVAGNASGSPLGWLFVTRAGLYGSDRTGGLEFSLENENIDSPSYAISHLDEVNAVFVRGGGRGNSQIIVETKDTTRINSSRWNRYEGIVSATNETESAGLIVRGQEELEKGRPREDIPFVFLNTPGSATTPRSLYGLDWDLGDLLRVNFARKQFSVEVNLIYVSVDENGVEKITGRNEVSNE